MWLSPQHDRPSEVEGDVGARRRAAQAREEPGIWTLAVVVVWRLRRSWAMEGLRRPHGGGAGGALGGGGGQAGAAAGAALHTYQRPAPVGSLHAPDRPPVRGCAAAVQRWMFTLTAGGRWGSSSWTRELELQQHAPPPHPPLPPIRVAWRSRGRSAMATLARPLVAVAAACVRAPPASSGCPTGATGLSATGLRFMANTPHRSIELAGMAHRETGAGLLI